MHPRHPRLSLQQQTGQKSIFVIVVREDNLESGTLYKQALYTSKMVADCARFIKRTAPQRDSSCKGGTPYFSEASQGQPPKVWTPS